MRRIFFIASLATAVPGLVALVVGLECESVHWARAAFTLIFASWVLFLLSKTEPADTSKQELRRRIRDQEDTIAKLMAQPVQQLAKLAWEGRIITMSRFIRNNADALRCLKGDDDAPA